MLMLGGPQKLHFFQSRVTQKTKLQSSTSLAAFTPGKVSRFYLLPPHNGAPPSPPVCTQDPSPCMGINKPADVVACRLPQGVPHYVTRFFYLALLAAQHRANHTHTMMFFPLPPSNLPPTPSIL
jgi:hypothetical protein